MSQSSLRNQRITVAGLGRFGGGIEVARWLCAQGARVLVTDRDTADKLEESVKKLEGLPIEFQLGGHRDEDFTQCDLVVTSPAFPLNHPFLCKARDAGVPITTEIRLFIERCPAKIIGVTGTKGKSTTTTLLGLMLRSAFTTWVGGNIGGSLLDKLPEIEPEHLVVLELSSYMLEHLGLARWSPQVAVVTMIAADHIEWHGSVEAYIEAKKNIVRFMREDGIAILNEENAQSASFAREAPGRVVYYGLNRSKHFELKIAGTHNQLNAQAAFAAADAMGISWDDAQNAIRDFEGLPHRLHVIKEADGIRWVNDSIATIPEAAIAALESFPSKRVIQIVGGYDKHLPLNAMCAALSQRAKAVLCIGQTGTQIAEMMMRNPIPTGASVYQCGDLATAVKMARSIATAGDIVLLSTGCASYDQFANFEQRGNEFTRLA